MSSTSKTLKIFWQEAWRFRFRTLFSIFNPVTTVLASSFAGPYIISKFLNQIQSGTLITLKDSVPLLCMYALTQLYGEMIGWRLTLLATWTMEVTAQKNLETRIFAHLTSQSNEFHANRFGGSLVSQTNKIIGSFERFWDTIIFQLMPSLTSVIAAVTILSFIFWQYAVILLVISVIFAITIWIGSQKMAPLNVAESKASTKLTGRLADAMTNILAIKSHGHEAYEDTNFNKLAEEWRSKNLKTMWGFLKVSSLYSALIVLLNLSAIILALWATEHHLISVSVVYLSVTYTFTVARQLWEMNNIMRNFNRVMGDAYEMTEILNMAPNIQDEPYALTPAIVRGDIVFDNVTFGHLESKNSKKLFEELQLHIRAGEKIGLVGHSGGGKTTLTKLLMRFMDIQNGEIRIDHQDIKKMKQSELRKSIAYVPQEPILFHRSLMDNIRYGRLDATDKEVEIVARLAHAEEFIEKLPDGYETLVGERGVKLSGGQRQRIVIARAMLKNAPILVLDEATSALDSESEELIQKALWKLMEGRTAIVIAHRLSTIQKMDRIIVLSDGKIVEQGTHKALISRKSIYADLWNKQTGSFNE